MGKIRSAPKKPFLEGKLIRDSLGYRKYVRVGDVMVQYWIFDRLHELPEGATVRITAEVVDNGSPAT